jgi:hypothetical protein
MRETDMTYRTSQWRALPVAVIFAASLAGGCWGHTDSVDNDRKVQAGGKRGMEERIKVEGCLQGAPGAPGREYVLAQVTMGGPATQPQGQETMEHGPLVAAGSWVRVAPGSEDLKNYIGQRVSITGEVVDTGDNTLGTSGRVEPNKEGANDHEKFEQSSRDASTNPDRAMPPSTVTPANSNANGNAPKIAVEKIEKLAGSCEHQ